MQAFAPQLVHVVRFPVSQSVIAPRYLVEPVVDVFHPAPLFALALVQISLFTRFRQEWRASGEAPAQKPLISPRQRTRQGP
ncbi:MAG TPA: hypothetical protein VGF67_02960 [Ktedonobacteraceae bacterium]